MAGSVFVAGRVASLEVASLLWSKIGAWASVLAAHGLSSQPAESLTSGRWFNPGIYVEPMFYIYKNVSQELELSHDAKHSHQLEPLFFVGQITDNATAFVDSVGLGRDQQPTKEPLIRLLSVCDQPGVHMAISRSLNSIPSGLTASVKSSDLSGTTIYEMQ